MSPVSADDGDRLGSLRQLCTSDEISGLDWDEGEWKTKRFKNEQFVLKLYESDGPDSKARTGMFSNFVRLAVCLEKHKPIEDKSELPPDFRFYETCVVRKFPGKSRVDDFNCDEVHEKNSNGNWNVKFKCSSLGERVENLIFEPGGRYHQSAVHEFLKPDENGNNDSMYISVGKCLSVD